MPFKPGEVVRVLDRQTRPPKTKRLICIVPERQFFLRINSEPKYRPNHPIFAADSNFLSHDSYVELRQFIRPFAYDIEQAEKLGELTQQQVEDLIEAVNQSKVLSQDHKDMVVEHLGIK